MPSVNILTLVFTPVSGGQHPQGGGFRTTLQNSSWKSEALAMSSTSYFGIPVSSFGVLYFTFLTAWFLGVGRP